MGILLEVKFGANNFQDDFDKNPQEARYEATFLG
jgi:hypothetical protein